MYSNILDKRDRLKKLDHIQKFDLEDYVSMRNTMLPCRVKFESIRSMVVTENGMTLWQLTEKYLDSTDRPIGQDEAPASLFQWVLTDTKFN